MNTSLEAKLAPNWQWVMFSVLLPQLFVVPLLLMGLYWETLGNELLGSVLRDAFFWLLPWALLLDLFILYRFACGSYVIKDGQLHYRSSFLLPKRKSLESVIIADFKRGHFNISYNAQFVFIKVDGSTSDRNLKINTLFYDKEKVRSFLDILEGAHAEA